ncbi:hypothetical protein F5050DRAFT_1904160 [Lentinula boryana]|uniref:Uncharacterized protein n=1 Tax=Lentinula boryana TaxID=40481 RepID=A0ABQ8Q763_9AGAR|nr:hypothetical protein F5050DRAFT_1904160 [Lentinula boryana]
MGKNGLTFEQWVPPNSGKNDFMNEVWVKNGTPYFGALNLLLKVIKSWIKKGKNANAKNIPPDVTEYLYRARKIPHTIASLLPNDALPVTKLIGFHFPTVQGEIVHANASTWFQEDASNCGDLHILLHTSIPPKSLVEADTSAFLARFPSLRVD